MSILVANCPRCGSNRITFDVTAQVYHATEYGWKDWYEVFSTCRNCRRPTIFLVALTEMQMRDTFKSDNALVKLQGSLNSQFEVDRPITLRDNVTINPPDHLPDDILNAFGEGAACLSIGCYNAAAAMFRLCLDLATRN